MKTYVICCNYNAVYLGTLPASLEALRSAKLHSPETVIGVIDNCSSDGSVDLLNSYRESGILNAFIASPQNYGKPKALNMLFRYLNDRYAIEDEDLVMSLDSDIRLLRDDFFAQLQIIAQTFRDGYSAISAVLQGNNIHYVNFERDCARHVLGFYTVYGWPCSDGVAGCVLVTTARTWRGIGGYRENTGRNGTSAIYGTDDCMLFRDAFAFNRGKPILISDAIACYHPPTTDQSYQEWKDTANRIAAAGFGNPDMLDKGYFDRQ